MKSLLTLVSFLFTTTLAAQWTQIGSDIDGEAAADQSGYSVSMPDSNTLGIGAKFNDGSAADAGHVRIFRRIASNWIQKGSDIDGEASGDFSGHSISMPDSNTIAIGAPNNDGNGSDAGHVRIFEWDGSSWLQKGVDLDGEAAGDFFGHSLSMPDQNNLAVGARGNDGNGPFSGHVRVFRWSGSAWVQKGVDIDGELSGSQSGYSVSMPDSNTVAIGAHRNSNPNGSISGHVRVYQWNGSAWIQKGSDIDGESAGDQSGYSVSMPDSNTVAIGAIFNSDNGTQSGHTRIYRWNGSTWVQKGADIDGEFAGDQSGSSLSMMDSNTVAIGAPLNGSTGHVRVFFWDGMNWSQLGSSIAGEEGGDQFGNSISMVNSRVLAIGAIGNDGNGIGSGHVRVFSFPCIENNVQVTHTSCPNCNDGSISVSPTAGNSPYTYNWSNSATDSSITGLSPGTYEVTITDASACSIVDTIEIGFEWLQRGLDIDGEAVDDGSGYSVSMGNVNTVAIGAPCNTANGFCSGHVRVFEWNGTVWMQKGADIDGSISDFFGFYVSMADENTFAVGAIGANSNAGLVKIYDWNGSNWVQRGTDINGEASGDRFGHSVSMADVNTVGIGGYWNDGNGTESGHTRVYEWDGFSWIQKGADIDGEAAFDRSGSSVSMADANTIAIGAVRNSGAGASAGHVRIFRWNGVTWIQKGADIDGEAAGDNAGYAVGMPNPNTVAIGAPFNDGNGFRTGQVRVYGWDGSSWVQKGADIDGEGVDDWSGFSVSMPDSNTVGIGAYRNDGNGPTAGHARVFSWNGSSWEQVGVDINSEAAGDQFGYSVSMADSSIIAIGATNNDGSGLDAGHVRVFGIPPPCSLSASITIQSNVSCNGSSDAILIASESGGTAAFTYAWSESTIVSSAMSADTLNGLPAGSYTVTITDANGCTAVDSAMVTEPNALSGSISLDQNVSCNGLTDGGLTVNATGGTTAYTYLWSNSATTASINGLSAGNYTVTVTDGNGCTTTTSNAITEPAALSANLAIDNNVSCNGLSDGGLTVNTTGGTTAYTYLWSNSATTASINGLSAGNYTVTVTDGNGCTTTSSNTITEPATLSANLTIDNNVSCNGGSDGGATASASGGISPYTYLWNNSATTASITSLTAGTYTITITDNNGCTTIASNTITEPTALSVSARVDQNASCNGGSNGGATASPSGGTLPYTYLWSNSATTATITGLSAGIYTVTVTDNNSCASTANATITEPTAITSILSSQDPSCFGAADGSATASPSGGNSPYTYLWSNTSTTQNTTALTAGSYTVTITDANGCTTTNSVTLTAPSQITSTLSSTLISCAGGNDGSASSSVSGGTSPYTYIWSNSATSSTINNLTFGTYILTVTDANGCTNVDSVLVNQANPLSAIITPTDVSCVGQSDGRALVSLTQGGTQPYNYNWSNSATGAQIINLSAGTYTVTVTDFNGCTFVRSTTINNPIPLSSNIRLDSNTRCFNSLDGGATAQISGGTTPYTFNWSASTFSDSILFSVGRGIYSVTATDANGCSIVDTVLINVIDTTDPQAIAQNITVYLDLGGNAIISGQDIDGGSTDNCSIANLSADPNNFDCDDLATNFVDLIVVDSRGNRDTDVAIVNVIDSFRPTAIARDLTVYLNSNKTVVVNAQDADNGSFDNCGIANFWLSDSTFSCNDVGLNTVSFYVSDAQGNRDTAVTNLTVVNSIGPINTLFSEAVCESYLWSRSGITYLNSGFYTFYDTVGTCDSIFNLDLEVRSLDLNMVNVGDSLFAFEENATYQWYDCVGDSIIPGAIGRGFRPDTSGFYAAIVDNGICFDTAACQEVIVVGIKEQDRSKAEINIYPNPTTNDFFFETDRFDEDSELIIYDMKGSIMLRSRVDENREKIETDNWNAGIYFVKYGEEVKKLVLTR